MLAKECGVRYNEGMIKICLLGMQTVSFDGDIDFKDVEALGEVVYANPKTPDELIDVCKDATAVLVNNTVLDEYVIARLPRLKFIGIFATGYNNVDLSACKKYGVTCSNAPNYSTHAVAQHAIGLMLAFAGSLPNYFASVKRGDWLTSKGFCYYGYPMHEVYGKTMGIFGFGNIGKSVAKIADALGMRVIFCNRSKVKNTPYRQVEADELFQTSDYISLHCPLNGDTDRIINKNTLAMMKKTAVLINTARGGLIDEDALSQALNEGVIAGACLDVLSQEPMQAHTPLRTTKNCLITPHAAWLPQETRQALERLVAQNLKAFLEGKPQNVVSE